MWVTVEIEVGAQGTEEVAASVEYQARAFLKRVDALPREPPDADPEYFHMADPIREAALLHLARSQRRS